MGTSVPAVSAPSTIPAGTLALSKLATQGDSTVVGVPVGGGTESPVAMTTTQLTALVNPATASLPGAMSAALASVLANATATGLAVTYTVISPTIDLTSSGSTGIVLIPAIAGFIVDGITFRGQVTGVAGTLSVQPTFTFGNDAGQTNVGLSAGSFATAFASGKNAGFAGSSLFSSGTVAIDLTTPVTLKMGTLGSGSGLVFTVKLLLTIALIPTA